MEARRFPEPEVEGSTPSAGAFCAACRKNAQSAGLEPARAEPSGFLVHPLNRLGTTAVLQSDRTQVVTGLDLKSSGLCPRRFEPCRSRIFASALLAQW
jgi:hypothetical protein